MNFITFQAATPADSKLLSTLFKTVYVETYGVEGITDEFADFMEQQFAIAKIEKDIAGEDCDLWIAKFKGNPVGVIQIEYDKACPIKNIVAPEINKLYILRNFYSKGIGQNLIRLAENQIREKGNDRTWLWVWEPNHRAVDFYYKQDFQNIGTAYFQINENKYKNIVMLKNL